MTIDTVHLLIFEEGFRRRISTTKLLDFFILPDISSEPKVRNVVMKLTVVLRSF